LIAAEQNSSLKTPKVKVAGKVGAGDSFNAAMVVDLLTGKTLVQTHQMAVNLSAFACIPNGAIARLPTRRFFIVNQNYSLGDDKGSF